MRAAFFCRLASIVVLIFFVSCFQCFVFLDESLEQVAACGKRRGSSGKVPVWQARLSLCIDLPAFTSSSSRRSFLQQHIAVLPGMYQGSALGNTARAAISPSWSFVGAAAVITQAAASSRRTILLPKGVACVQRQYFFFGFSLLD